MRISLYALLVALSGYFISSSAEASQIRCKESFLFGSNYAGWTFGSNATRISKWGGSPGHFLLDESLVTYAPQAYTRHKENCFTGDFKAKNVSTIMANLRIFSVDFEESLEGRPLSLLLWSENGTPQDASDDWVAYVVGGEDVPMPSKGWMKFEFKVPSQAPEWPQNWRYLPKGPHSPLTVTWENIIRNVDGVGFYFGDPSLVSIFQTWNIGLDNPEIVYNHPRDRVPFRSEP